MINIIRNVEYPESILHTLKQYREQGPWRGSFDERKAKLQMLHRSLNQVTDLTTALEITNKADQWGGGAYHIPTNTIILSYNLSVVTYLHEYAHAMGMDSEEDAVVWSANLFKRIFPKSFSALKVESHRLVRRSN